MPVGAAAVRARLACAGMKIEWSRLTAWDVGWAADESRLPTAGGNRAIGTDQRRSSSARTGPLDGNARARLDRRFERRRTRAGHI